MDVGTILIILALIVIIILFSLFRRRGGPSKYPQIVQSLLWDIKINQVLADTIQARPKAILFEKVNWQLNKSHVRFLNENVQQDLKDTFDLTEEFNNQIKLAKKAKSDTYKTLDMTRFKELLAKCREELEDWMVKTTGSKELPPKYPSLTSIFFGDP
jgi:hypothetical protein